LSYDESQLIEIIITINTITIEQQEQEQQQQTMGHPGYLLPHVISDTDFNLVDFINSHWKYRGEGNANIVIALEDVSHICEEREEALEHDDEAKTEEYVYRN